MINKTEMEEKAYLEETKRKLDEELARIDVRVWDYTREIREQKTYLWEHRSDMDHIEKMTARQSADQMVRSNEGVIAHENRLRKLRQSPYFGRFDFVPKGVKTRALPVYIGLHSFIDEVEKKNVVFDWRAPISTMFYDYELGEARYTSPSGDVSGEILVKRQYRIRRGKMEFMLESGLNILDDVLQEELSRASDDKMKTIVATIQRDQNAIIRNEDAQVLIIQGVAGSGKTSIALHRIAFMLYRFKETLTAKDILIISPNKVFADFIANVLPELGEEQIAEKEMETLAGELLESKFTFQTSFEQSTLLLENDDAEMRRRIREKSSHDFLKLLDKYIEHVENTRFIPADLRIGGSLFRAPFIAQAYNTRRGRPGSERLTWVAQVIAHDLWLKNGYEITAKERAELKASLRKMHRSATLRTLYREFFAWLGKPELFKPVRNSKLEFSDVFPLIYLKMRLEGMDNRYKDVRHLLIDEMQDYSPVQYAVIAKLFPCGKTILGDANQSVNPYSASTSESIHRVFRQAECVKLCKSYRSSYEITRFAQSISPDADLVAIERHGDEPLLVACKDRHDEINRIRQAIAEFETLAYQTMGIICKTQKQAAHLHRAVREEVPGTHLLTAQSTSFQQGVVICTAHLAKGLEFDLVHVAGISDDNYATAMDRNLLYVACTRAMHKLTLSYVGTVSRLINNQKGSENHDR
ncbi:MAG: AAA family ATPase [Deltaproteobacteria bacterium]|nr:AAA family ATPase [Deltaproteobacteria bacterium]